MVNQAFASAIVPLCMSSSTLGVTVIKATSGPLAKVL
jgi:hypothetical protein